MDFPVTAPFLCMACLAPLPPGSLKCAALACGFDLDRFHSCWRPGQIIEKYTLIPAARMEVRPNAGFFQKEGSDVNREESG